MWYKEQVSSCSMRIVLSFLGLHFSNFFFLPPGRCLPELNHASSADTRLVKKQEAPELGAQKLQFFATCSGQRDSIESTVAVWAKAHLLASVPSASHTNLPLTHTERMEKFPSLPFPGLWEARVSGTVRCADDHNTDHPRTDCNLPRHLT